MTEDEIINPTLIIIILLIVGIMTGILTMWNVSKGNYDSALSLFAPTGTCILMATLLYRRRIKKTETYLNEMED